MRRKSILVTGAAGFLGRHVVEEALHRDVSLTLMSHLRGVCTSGFRRRVVSADLTDADSLRGVCEGIDVLLHCASYTGGSPQAGEAVNARGTRSLVAEAQRAGVRRIVYLSTASVYGRGTFRRAAPAELRRQPGSPASLTRAAAEDAVLAAGGIVLRPHLVFGRGDTWVVPGAGRLLQALPGTVEGWRARLSLVSAGDLARLTVAVGLAPAAELSASVYHACHPVPVTARSLLGAVAECGSLAWPHTDLTLRRAQELLAADPVSRHALGMLSSDHWFDSTPIWRDVRLAPGPGFEDSFAQSADWYRSALTGHAVIH